MKIKSISIIAYLLCICSIATSQAPNLTYIGNPAKQIEYKCVTEEPYYLYEIPYFRLDSLIDDEVYIIYKSPAEVFDALTYSYHPNGFHPISSCWRWNYFGESVDTVVVSFDGEYKNLELGAWQSIRLSIGPTPGPYPVSQKFAGVTIVPPNPDMEIIGPDLVCDTPVYFYLHNMPTTYTTASWEIKRGSFVANSGSDTTAIASNLSNGAWEVVFTIHFSCGLKNLEYKKDFWFGPPPAPTISPAIITYKQINSVFNVIIIDSPHSDQASETWETYGCTYPNGTPSGSSANFFSCDNDGCGTIYVSTSNACGTYYKTSLTVITGNGGDCGPLPERASTSSISLSPNPANTYVELKINKIDSKLERKEFRVEIYNAYFRLIKLLNIHQTTERIDISDLPHGNYIIKVIGRDLNVSKQLLIQK